MPTLNTLHAELYQVAKLADEAYSTACALHGGDRWTEGIDQFPTVKAVYLIKVNADKALHLVTRAMRKEGP